MSAGGVQVYQSKPEGFIHNIAKRTVISLLVISALSQVVPKDTMFGRLVSDVHWVVFGSASEGGVSTCMRDPIPE